MRRLLNLLPLTLLLVAGCSPRATNAKVPTLAEGPIELIFDEVTEDHGVAVRWKLGPGFFPVDWLQYGAKATPIEERELRRMPRLLAQALAPYPKALLSTELRRVCYAKDLFFYGQPYGGTNSSDTIYLSSEGVSEGFTDAYMVGSLHHEFSSILMRNRAFDEDAWAACNLEDFRYASEHNGGVEAIESGATGLDGHPTHYARGLLCEYGGAELEEDVNTFAELLMTEPEKLRKIERRYPVVAAKAKLLREFYRSLGVDVE